MQRGCNQGTPVWANLMTAYAADVRTPRGAIRSRRCADHDLLGRTRRPSRYSNKSTFSSIVISRPACGSRNDS